MDGTDRMKEIAGRKKDYIAQQLQQATEASQQKLKEMQRFKEAEQITDLNSEEIAIVGAIQDADKERQRLLVQIATVREAITSDSIGLDALNRLAAVEGVGANSALDFQIQNLLKLYDDRRTLTAGPLGLQEKNPQIDAIDQRIRQGNAALRAAVAATLQSLNNRLQSLDNSIRQMKNRLKSFPGQETPGLPSCRSKARSRARPTSTCWASTRPPKCSRRPWPRMSRCSTAPRPPSGSAPR